MNKKNNENQKNPITKYADYFIENTEALGSLLGDFLGIGIPVVSNIYLTYKQKRIEKRLVLFSEEVIKNQAELEEMISSLSEEKFEFVRNILLPITFDYIMEEKQDEKIQYYVTGLKTLVKNQLNIIEAYEMFQPDNLIIYYFDILKQLTISDIRLLKLISKIDSNKEIEVPKPELLDRSDLYKVTLKHSFSKLKDVGVILAAMTLGELGGEDEYTAILENAKITAIGSNFIKFIFD